MAVLRFSLFSVAPIGRLHGPFYTMCTAGSVLCSVSVTTTISFPVKIFA